jgi:hypothetical protein
MYVCEYHARQAQSGPDGRGLRAKVCPFFELSASNEKEEIESLWRRQARYSSGCGILRQSFSVERQGMPSIVS